MKIECKRPLSITKHGIQIVGDKNQVNRIEYAGPFEPPPQCDPASHPLTDNNGSLAAFATLIIPVFPVFGRVLEIGPVYLLGGTATFAGAILAIIGLTLYFRKASVGVWTLSIILNSLSALYFFKLFFG
jgi:hypothetical protein